MNALHAHLVHMSTLQAALAALTVLLVHIRSLKELTRHLTALLATLADMVQEAALRVSALVTVLPVGTPPKRLVRVHQRLTALRATWALSLMVWAVPASRAALHVPLGGMSM